MKSVMSGHPMSFGFPGSDRSQSRNSRIACSGSIAFSVAARQASGDCLPHHFITYSSRSDPGSSLMLILNLDNSSPASVKATAPSDIIEYGQGILPVASMSILTSTSGRPELLFISYLPSFFAQRDQVAQAYRSRVDRVSCQPQRPLAHGNHSRADFLARPTVGQFRYWYRPRST